MVSGTIAYCSREEHVWPVFANALAMLVQRHPDAHLSHIIGGNIAESRNYAAREMQGDWLWFIDTDMTFPPGILEQLLAHEVPVVQTLCLCRHPPHTPILHTEGDDHRDQFITGTGLVTVQSLGSGGTLYRKECFTAVKDPWFEGVLGQEDVVFAAKLKDAGVPLAVDRDALIGHITPMIVWPYRFPDGRWGHRYQAMNGLSLAINSLVDPTKEYAQ